jgi:hypothetical protein
MRVNIYAEEMTDRIEIVSKTINGKEYTGLRIYLELPVTVEGKHIKGPFEHHPGDDDSSAITFWGKADLVTLCEVMRVRLIDYFESRERAGRV